MADDQDDIGILSFPISSKDCDSKSWERDFKFPGPVLNKKGELVSGSKDLAVFIDRQKLYGPTACHFNGMARETKDDLAKSLQDTTHRMLETFGAICRFMSQSPVQRTGTRHASPKDTFIKYQVFVRRIRHKPDDSVRHVHKHVGWIFVLRYAGWDSASDRQEKAHFQPENPEHGQTEKQKMQQREHEINKHPIRRLEQHLDAHSGKFDPELARTSFTRSQDKSPLWIDNVSKTEFLRVLGAYAGEPAIDDALSLPLSHLSNPACLWRAMGLDKAIELALLAGGNPDDLDAAIFEKGPSDEDTGPDGQPNMYHLPLTACEPRLLMYKFFPETPKQIDVDLAGLPEVSKRVISSHLRERYGVAFAMKIAQKHTTISLYNTYCNKPDKQNLEALKEFMTRLWRNYEMRCKETDPALKMDHSSKAMNRLEIQKVGMEHFARIMHPDGNIPMALRAISKHMNEVLQNSPHHNLCRPLPRTTSNLTWMGEYYAYILSCLEKQMGMHVVHLEYLLLMLCEFHVNSGDPVHPNCFFTGDTMSGKSYGHSVKEKASIPGTRCKIVHLTKGALQTNQKRDLDKKIVYSDEIQPSMFGVDASGKAVHNAQTDQAAGWRTMLTEGYMSAARLEKHSEFGGYKRETVEARWNLMFTGCFNPFAGGIPANMKSRFLIVNVDPREREDTTAHHKVILANTEKDSEDTRLFLSRMQRDQMVLAYVQEMITCNVFGMNKGINRGVTDSLLLRLIERALKKQLTAFHDKRKVMRLRQVIDMNCLLRVSTEYLDSGLFKDPTEPFSMDDFLAISTMLHTSTEDLVMALTLMGSQFEDPVMYDVVRALALYSEKDHERTELKNKKDQQKQDKQTNPWEKEEKETKQQEAGSGDINRDKGALMSVSYDTNDGVYINGKPTERTQQISNIAADQTTNYIVNRTTIDQRPGQTDTELCKKLASLLTRFMKTKTSIRHIEECLVNLHDEPSPTGNTMLWWRSIPNSPNKELWLYSPLIENNTANRLQSVIQELVDSPHLPRINYFTGIMDTKPYAVKLMTPKNMNVDGKDEKVSRASELILTNPEFVDPGVEWVINCVHTYDQEVAGKHVNRARNLFKAAKIRIDEPIDDHHVMKDFAKNRITADVLQIIGFDTPEKINLVKMPSKRYDAQLKNTVAGIAHLTEYPRNLVVLKPRQQKEKKSNGKAQSPPHTPDPHRRRVIVKHGTPSKTLASYPQITELSVDGFRNADDDDDMDMNDERKRRQHKDKLSDQEASDKLLSPIQAGATRIREAKKTHSRSFAESEVKLVRSSSEIKHVDAVSLARGFQSEANESSGAGSDTKQQQRNEGYSAEEQLWIMNQMNSFSELFC